MQQEAKPAGSRPDLLILRRTLQATPRSALILKCYLMVRLIDQAYFLASGPTALAPEAVGRWPPSGRRRHAFCPRKAGGAVRLPSGEANGSYGSLNGSGLGQACSRGNSNLKPCDGLRRNRESIDDKIVADRG